MCLLKHLMDNHIILGRYGLELSILLIICILMQVNFGKHNLPGFIKKYIFLVCGWI